jgi:hypothetical protein
MSAGRLVSRWMWGRGCIDAQEYPGCASLPTMRIERLMDTLEYAQQTVKLEHATVVEEKLTGRTFKAGDILGNCVTNGR